MIFSMLRFESVFAAGARATGHAEVAWFETGLAWYYYVLYSV